MRAILTDITTLPVDAIVNAANSSLMGGGGVDGAIHAAGGPAIIEACKEIVARQGPCVTGDAVVTTGGKLKARYVIHTVGPVWHGGNNKERELLTQCYLNSLRLAQKHNCSSIAFPAISTGVYGYPKDLAAAIAVSTVFQFMKNNSLPSDVTFACFDKETLQLVQSQINMAGI